MRGGPFSFGGAALPDLAPVRRFITRITHKISTFEIRKANETLMARTMSNFILLLFVSLLAHSREQITRREVRVAVQDEC